MLLWESILVQGVVLWVYCGHHFWYRGGTVGIMFGTGVGSVGVLWEAVFGTEGAYCGWHFGTGVEKIYE